MMQHGINAAVAATVPKCARKVDAARYFMAIRCGTYAEAYKKWLLPIAHLLPVPLEGKFPPIKGGHAGYPPSLSVRDAAGMCAVRGCW